MAGASGLEVVEACFRAHRICSSGEVGRLEGWEASKVFR